MKTPLRCRLKNWFRFRPISPTKVSYYKCALGLRCVDDRCVQCPNDLREHMAMDAFIRGFMEGFNEGLKNKGVKADDR